MWESMIDIIKKELMAIIPIESIVIDVERIKRGRDDETGPQADRGYVDYPVAFNHPVTGIKHEVTMRKIFFSSGWEIKVGDEFKKLGPGMLYKELYYKVAEMRLP